jgi:hypothetical protein
MQNKNFSNWSVHSGDYHRKDGDYDKLYHQGKKRAKMKRFLLWTGAVFLSFFVLFKVLAYAAAN